MQPANFVLDDSGRLKLIDFDEAITFNNDIISESDKKKIMERKYASLNLREEDLRQLELLEQSRQRQPTYVGTPSYMAPEFKVDNGEVDERSDIYSFGCVIYEILTGKVLQTEELDAEEQASSINKALEKLSKVLRGRVRASRQR